MLTENDIKTAFLKTNKAEPLSEGYPGLLRFGREVERVTALDMERDLYLKIGELEDETELLRALCDDLYSDILAAASLAPKDCGAYGLLHETIRLRRDRWARKVGAGETVHNA